MVIEKQKTILPSLTRLSASSALRDSENAFLKRYALTMEYRQSFFVEKQKQESLKNSSNIESFSIK